MCQSIFFRMTFLLTVSFAIFDFVWEKAQVISLAFSSVLTFSFLTLIILLLAKGRLKWQA